MQKNIPYLLSMEKVIEFLTGMNVGSRYEIQILQCIINAVEIYYGVNKVIITLDGKLYSSGHFQKKKGECFTVDLKNSLPLK